MRYSIGIKLSIFIVVIGAICSCNKKYEEGPRFSLRSEKHRVVNQWEVIQAFYFDSMGDPTPDDCTVEAWHYGTLEFTEDFTYTIIRYSPDSLVKVVETGTWYLFNKKRQIRTTGTETESLVETGETIDEWNTATAWLITKLTEDEMWIWYLYESGAHEELWLRTLQP